MNSKTHIHIIKKKQTKVVLTSKRGSARFDESESELSDHDLDQQLEKTNWFSMFVSWEFMRFCSQNYDPFFQNQFYMIQNYEIELFLFISKKWSILANQTRRDTTRII